MIKAIGIEIKKYNTSVDAPVICSMDYNRCKEIKADFYDLFCYNDPLHLPLLGDVAMCLRKYPVVSAQSRK